MIIASFGAFLAFLDATIVNVCFPAIAETFPDTSTGALSWVLNAYNWSSRRAWSPAGGSPT